jgi:Phosphotransferase system, mannose/fructose-specific component IIA
MVGVVVVTHGRLAEELVSVVKFVTGGESVTKMEHVHMDPSKEFEKFAQEIKKSRKKKWMKETVF